MKLTPQQMIARRAALELADGDIVNLGIGIPLLVADYVPDGVRVHLHTENGMLEMGPPPESDVADPQIVNAAKQPVSEIAGASYFDSSSSFAMIRGGHVDAALLGALQVDENGVLANWTLPGRSVLGVGGAMDLLAGARRVIVLTTHCTKDGDPKLVQQLTCPPTGLRRVDTIITERAVFRNTVSGLVLTELQEGWTVDQVRQSTEARFEVALDQHPGRSGSTASGEVQAQAVAP